MLRVQNFKGKLLYQWSTNLKLRQPTFIVHNEELLDYFKDELSITLFYGFLDQDTQGMSASEYATKIYKQDGIKGLNRCYGSFIFMHYDNGKNHLTIANDALGDFAVHYIEDSKNIMISDLPATLLTQDNNVLNQERIMDYFALSQPQKNGSFFKNVTQLNPGCYVTIGETSIKKGQYYRPAEKVDFNTKKSLSKSTQQYVKIVQDVIAQQTRGQSRVGIMMSGGMDSTFVAANCLEIGKKVSTFSYVFPTMPEADETKWINSMQNMGFDINTFPGESDWPLKAPWQQSAHSPLGNPYRGLKTKIYHQVQEKGIKILLSGDFADHMYTGYSYWLVDQFKHQPIRAIKSFFSSLVTQGIKTTLKQISPAKWSNTLQRQAPWLNENSLTAFQALQKKQHKFNHPHPRQFALSYGIGTAQSYWLEHEYMFKNHVILRHPFRDRRVVEFLMSLPAWLLGKVNEPKRFVRKAAQNLLPNSITERETITSLKPLFIKGLIEKELDFVIQLLNQKEAQWQNFIQQDIIQKILNNPHQKHKDAHYLILWQCISFELWRKTNKFITKS